MIALFFKDIITEFKGMSMKMKSLQALMLAIVISCVFLACSSVDPGKAYVEANFEFSKLALPDLVQYIEQDQKLQDIDKKARVESVKQWQKLLESRYKEVFEGKK